MQITGSLTNTISLKNIQTNDYRGLNTRNSVLVECVVVGWIGLSTAISLGEIYRCS